MCLTISEELKQQWKGIRGNYRRCIQKPQLKQRSGARSSQLRVCRYYEQLRFLHDTISSDETDGNFDIEFSQRASPNVESKVIESEGGGNYPVSHEVISEKNEKSEI